MKKKVLFVTNSRSEMTTVLSMLSHAVTSEVIDPYLMVGGTHFSEKYEKIVTQKNAKIINMALDRVKPQMRIQLLKLLGKNKMSFNKTVGAIKRSLS